jgi:uncharacterized protein YeaO (DUF488 family)
MPCVVRPAPTGVKQIEVSANHWGNRADTNEQLLTSLSTWPVRFGTFQTAWKTQVGRKERETKKKAAMQPGGHDEVSVGAGSTVESEAWALVQQLSGMNTRSFVQKTSKNLQAMGASLTWIIEVINAYACRALNCVLLILG